MIRIAQANIWPQKKNDINTNPKPNRFNQIEDPFDKKNRDSLNPRTITNKAKTRKDPKLNKTQFRKLIIGNKIQIELGNQKQRESNEPILDSLVIDLGANKKRIKKGTNWILPLSIDDRCMSQEEEEEEEDFATAIARE